MSICIDRLIPRTDLAQADQQTKATASEQNFGGKFFQTRLAKSRGSTSAESQLWPQGIYDEIRTRMPLQGELGVERMCDLGQVSRAGFYLYLRRGWQDKEEVAPLPSMSRPSNPYDNAT